MYAIATIRCDSRPTPVIEVDGRHHRLEALAPDLFERAPSRGLLNLFDDWEQSEQRLATLAERIAGSSQALVEPQPGDFMAPLQYPPKLLLAGANYYEHMARDAGKPDFSKSASTPVFFLKPPTTSLVGCGGVRYPVQSRALDWEIELAVVIGRRLRRVDQEQAIAGVAGYAVGIDLSARDWQMNPRHPWRFDLFTGKSFDDSCPLGPKIVPARFVDPGKLRLTLRVNGEVKQDANSDDMIWSVAEQVSLLSEHCTLEPGDVLLTGTPAGVGMASGTYLSVGDRIEATITGLGTLSVEITPDERTPGTPAAG
ncbi:MAG TPA: fumarylacetoacetate hydrolase family protein [Ramlibacter sp.]|nr:fumarylacetoacetate hydrolase family protein [Ramlibacter sp.]